jgi:hypothetical protein
LDAVSSFFKVPLEIEWVFDAKVDNVLISVNANLFEALPGMKHWEWEKVKPTPGAGMFLARGVRLFLGLGSAIDFKIVEW